MTQASWPSPNHGSPARAVTDAEYPHLAPWASDGVFQSASDVVYANASGREVHVRAEKRAIVQGHAWYSGTSEYLLTIAANASGSTRIDTVVLRLDRSTWDVTTVVRQGTPGAGAPTLQRDVADTGLWEIPLADVTVDNGVATIAAGKVTQRPLLQSGAVRPCNVITDIQSTLAVGDIVYEASTGRWIGWTGAGAVVLYQDTGWLALTPTGHWAAGGFTPQIRRAGNVVMVRGDLARTVDTLQSTVTSSAMANIDSQFRPAATHNWASVTSTNPSPVRLQVTFGGVLQLVAAQVDIAPGRTIYVDTTYLAG